LRRPLDMPDFRSFAVEVKKPGATLAGNVPTLGNFLREVMRLNMHNFRVVGPDETQSNRLEALYDVAKKVWLGEYFPVGPSFAGPALPPAKSGGTAPQTKPGFLRR
jgi:xylulose-5-phosphate/fructose-6-phosphate phosphoketolase